MAKANSLKVPSGTFLYVPRLSGAESELSLVVILVLVLIILLILVLLVLVLVVLLIFVLVVILHYGILVFRIAFPQI